MDGKIAVVTGGGSGIGRAIALKFAAYGSAVRILDVSPKGAEMVCQEILDAGGNAAAYQCDVTNQKEVQSRFDEFFLEDRIHILVNNAGISQIGTVESTTEADFDSIFRVNVKGFYNCMHACVGHMKAKGKGVILNMASTAGSLGIPDRFAYSMTKGTVIAMTLSVARGCLSYNIRCNCFRQREFTLPLSMDTCVKIIQDKRRKCSTNWPRLNLSEEWQSPRKWHPLRFFCVRRRPRLSPAPTIHWTEASSIFAANRQSQHHGLTKWIWN